MADPQHRYTTKITRQEVFQCHQKRSEAQWVTKVNSSTVVAVFIGSMGVLCGMGCSDQSSLMDTPSPKANSGLFMTQPSAGGMAVNTADGESDSTSETHSDDAGRSDAPSLIPPIIPAEPAVPGESSEKRLSRLIAEAGRLQKTILNTESDLYEKKQHLVKERTALQAEFDGLTRRHKRMNRSDYRAVEQFNQERDVFYVHKNRFNRQINDYNKENDENKQRLVRYKMLTVALKEMQQ